MRIFHELTMYLISFIKFLAHIEIIIASMAIGTLQLLIEKYLYNDWSFLISLIIIIGLDTLLGIWYAIKTKTLSSSGFAKFFEKIIIYAIFLILIHVLMNFTVHGSKITVFSWFDSVLYSSIMVREAISIIENIGKIKPDLLPTWILAKLKGFDDTGNFQQLQNPNQS